MVACLIEISSGQEDVSVFNAGLPYVLICDEVSSFRQKIPSNHLPLGTVENNEMYIKIGHHKVAREGHIYVYTDGLIEALNESGEECGFVRLERCLENQQDASKAFEAILESIIDFRGSADQSDDTTLVEISCNVGRMEKVDSMDTKENFLTSVV